MELHEEQLKQKAILLLQRERELFDLRMKHEQVTAWLKFTQTLPRVAGDPHVAIADVYGRIRKALIEGLRLQRVMFIELDGETLRPLVPAGQTRNLGPETLSLLRMDPAGFGNDPSGTDGAGLAEAFGLARFIWSRIDLPGRPPIMLVAGFDKAKAKFQLPFVASDADHLRNATQHLQSLLGNVLLVQELERERDRLQQSNTMLERRDRELHALADELQAANESLEHRVDERTRALGRRNGDMRLVLDNVAQALLTIDAAGRLAQERSAKVDEWFGSYEGTPSFADFIAHVDPLFAESFALAHEALTDQILPTEICLKQLPARLSAKNRTFHCTYLPLPEAANGSGLLIVIDDVTDQLRRAQEEAEQSELLAAFQGLTRDRDGFIAFFNEANHLVEELAAGRLDDVTQSRHLHTLKGNAAMMGAKVIAELCHRAEDELAMDGISGLEETMRRLEQRWATLRQTIEMVAGERAKGMLEIPSSAIERLTSEVCEGAAPDHVVRQLMAFRLESVERPLARLAQYARALAQRMDKGELAVFVDAADVRVDPRRFGGLWSALVHLVRNAIDHGFERSEERLSRGKKAGGQLTLRAAQAGADLALEVEDDGKGIDWTRVRALAAARRLPHETESDLIQAILSDGFSTRSTVMGVSGRGVGMSAVAHQVHALGGTLSVQSVVGRGTCWRMVVPLSRPNGMRAAAPAELDATRA
jgi:two-component system chemotaxis sensor kinase CheA